MNAAALAFCALFASAPASLEDDGSACYEPAAVRLPHDSGRGGFLGSADTGSSSGAFVIALGLIGCAAGGFFLMKRMKGLGTDSDVSIELIASKMLSPKVRLVVIRTDNRDFLLSVGSDGASLISEWTNQTADLVSDRDAARELERELTASNPNPDPDPEPVVRPPRVQPAALAEDWSPAVSGLLNLRKNNRSDQ